MALLRKLEAWEAPLAQPHWYDGSDWRHWQEEQLKNHTMAPQASESPWKSKEGSREFPKG